MARKIRQLPPGVIAVARDRLGREVRLTEIAMRHIREGHPELDGCDLAITTTIETARDRSRGNPAGRFERDREVLFAPNLGPGPWLAVVVAYSESGGEVITAYAAKKGPKDADRL